MKCTIYTKPYEEAVRKVIAIRMYVAMVILYYQNAGKRWVPHAPLLWVHTLILPDLIQMVKDW
jgi:hypothetical protein